MPLVLLIQSLCDQNAITGDERSYETQFEKRGGLVFINFSKIYWVIHIIICPWAFMIRDFSYTQHNYGTNLVVIE